MIPHRTLAVLLTLALAACDQSPPPVQIPPPTVSVHVASIQPLNARREFIGRTSATARVELRARVTGILEQSNFEEGGPVTAGQVLFEIEPDAYQARVDQAAAEIESAKARVNETAVRLARLEQLAANRNVSEQDVDEARAESLMARSTLDSAQAALEQARLDLRYTRISAPVSGRIGEAAIDTGNLVGPDSGVLATIVRMDPIRVHFTLSDVEYLEFRRRRAEIGLPTEANAALAATLQLSDQSRYPHPGTLELIDNEIDPGTGTISVRASFPNPDYLLRPGQFVTVSIEASEAVNVLMVPQAAVLTGQAGHSVMVVGDDNIAEQRAIETGETSGDMRVVRSGLEEGDAVIVRGLQNVRPGMTVAVAGG